jgi:hypothetical protein
MANIIRFPDRNRNSSGRPFALDDRPMPMMLTRVGGQADLAAGLASGATDEYEPRRLTDAPDGNVVLQAIALCETARQVEDVLPLDMAWVIRSAMPWLKRGGRKLSSLPELHRGLLDQHCAAGNPTAIMFRDWIKGKHLDAFVRPAGDARLMDLLPSRAEIQGGL